MISIASLDIDSQRILELFVKTYPEWESCVALDTEDPSVAFIEVASSRSVGAPLIVSFADGEITFMFDKYHKHFGWAEQTPEEVVADAKSFIDKFLKEEILVGVRMEGDDWQSSLTLTPDDINTQMPSDVTYTRSWLGTYDHNSPRKPGEGTPSSD
jgi:hypothetical protein